MSELVHWTPPPVVQPVEALRARIINVCGDFALEPRALRGRLPDEMRGGVQARRLGRFDTACVTLDARTVQRDRGAIRRDPGEHMFLLVQEQGEAWIEQAGQITHLTPGEMCLVDSARPSRFVYGAETSHQLSLHLPRDEMVHRFNADRAAGFAVFRDDPLWLPMRAVIGRMVEADPVEGPGLGEALLGLMGAWMAARAAGDRGNGLITRAMSRIDARAADPDFGPGQLADDLGVSERVLQRHFHAIGQTPGRAIVEARLTRAMARLRAGHQPITAVAFGCGFNDLSYFYREFRRRFGQAPGAVQRAGVSDLSKNPRGSVQSPAP